MYLKEEKNPVVQPQLREKGERNSYAEIKANEGGVTGGALSWGSPAGYGEDYGEAAVLLSP